jgi:putative DNA methylase
MELTGEARLQSIADGATTAYADAIHLYLVLIASKLTMFSNSLARWRSGEGKSAPAFGRQALPMVWDFTEVNPFAGAGGDFSGVIDGACKVIAQLGVGGRGFVDQLDATADTAHNTTIAARPVVSTDPPYYDNIGYSDLSDFFYIWIRQGLENGHRQLLSTLVTPKKQELVADPYRFDGDKDAAKISFENGFGRAFGQIRRLHRQDFPLTVYYAFKQTEVDEGDGDPSDDAYASTGWETMLEGLLKSGFQVTGTWPTRTEGGTRLVSMGTNSLASSIVLVCRHRPDSAPITTRKDFLSSLKKELPQALRNLQKGNIAPVDLAQAAIGPGMAVFSRYKKVLETDGSPMRVRTALALINQGLDEVLSELESEFDPDTRWALAWFEQYQFEIGDYGQAEVLATAKALSVSRLAESGMLHSRAKKVRLLRREELPEDWDPSTVGRLTVWEVTQHLIRSLDQKGEKETANLKAKIGGMAEIARDLAYRLYTLCERKGWADEAGYYNSLVVAWPSMASEAFELK